MTERLPDVPERKALADRIIENQEIVIPENEIIEERAGVDDEDKQRHACHPCSEVSHVLYPTHVGPIGHLGPVGPFLEIIQRAPETIAITRPPEHRRTDGTIAIDETGKRPFVARRDSTPTDDPEQTPTPQTFAGRCLTDTAAQTAVADEPATYFLTTI